MDTLVLSSDQEKIICYLDKYGNTREADLVKYGVARLRRSEASMRKLISDMISIGRLEPVVHKDLRPPVTYIREGPNASLELELQALANSLSPGETKQDLEAVKRILEEAEALVHKREREKSDPRQTGARVP